MAGEVRARMIEGAIVLLAQRGLQGASFAEVLELTGAPRGSIYHHFPGGKDQLVTEAITLATERALALLGQKAGRPAVEVAEFFLDGWRTLLTRSDLTAGCSLLAVTVATDSPELREHAAKSFQRWRSGLADLLIQGGLKKADGERYAAGLLAASEGAVVMARAEQDLRPFELVASVLVDQIRAAAA
jgi:TetR/AcrR family transcriptional repressor of lmrAB and yxaGH operons